MRVILQPAFVLHHRPYRETSLLVDLLTQDHGRISAVARGVRSQRSPLRALLQPFVPVLISWQGKSELMTLLTAEPHGAMSRLKGENLLSGLYLNELLMKVLPKQDAHPTLYTIYQQTLLELQAPQLSQKTLRLFEKRLLEELGYGLQLKHDASTGQHFTAENYYRFLPEYGFELCTDEQVIMNQQTIFLGKSLQALAMEQLEDETCLRDAKRLMRLALTPLLGQHQLHSRRLYLSGKTKT